MTWWPFGKKSEPKDLQLDPKLQTYFDSVTYGGDEKTQSTPEKQRNAAVVNRAVQFSDGRREKTLKQIALDNCVEYENAYSKCLLKGSYFERFTGCKTEQTMYDKCTEMQSNALAVLGYARTSKDDERRAIKNKADDLMIQAAPSLIITESQEAKFNELLEIAK